LSGSFEYSVNAGDYLFVERAETIASDSTSFTSIDYTRNSELSSNKTLKGYISSALFDNFELYLDPYNVIYEADSDMDGKRDFKHVIDVDKNGKIDVIRFGVESDVNSNEIVWHTVINDFLGDESLYNLKSRPKETTQWFDVDDAQFATSISGLTILFTDLDYWAKKSVEQTYSTDYSIQSSFYSVMVDEDYDGAADIQYTYEKTDTVQYTRVTNNETTILAAKPQNSITYIYASMAEWIGSLISGGRVDPIFNEKLTVEMIESGSYPSSYHWLASDIRETLTQTYKKYSIITTKLYVDNQISEQITINSWDNGTLIETRVYKDLFEDETIDLGIDLSQTITSLETGQQQDVPLDFIPAVQTEEYDKWNDGSNVPSKFESLTIVNSETSSSENINLFEREINIVIPSRINPYDDYKKVVSLKTSSTSDMKLNITGVFITPADGKVYYTSDKESFKRNGGKAAKTNGHYLYYDSDENGFWETVYVLSPVKSKGEGAYYEVMAIGFNYDGKHDFIPYSRTVTGWPIENLNEFKDVLSHEVHLTGGGNKFTFAKLGGCDRLFPEDERDGYELKDNVFEIRKLITKSVQNAKFSELFYETRHKEFNKVWEIFGERYERDLTEQVTISIIAGVAAVLARILTDLVALPVYFAIYTSLSLITNDVKAREAEAKLRSQTFYSEDANSNQPRILNKKYPTDDIWSDSMPAALSGHPGTYYAEVRGGQTGNEYFAYVVAAPPSDARCWGGSNSGFLDFIWSNIDLKWTNTLPQDVNPDIMAGLDFDYHNLDFLMVSSELYSYNDQKHYTYFEDPDLVDKMLELEPIYVVYEPTFFSAPMKFYKTGPQMVLRIIQNYNSYKLRQNTLGYLQHEINEKTGGSLNSIKPICSDAIPQYLFAQEDDTAPLSSLFSPLIISSQRYNQLSESRKFGYLFVDIASFGASNTKGIDSTDLLDEEKEFYSAKIPLADLYGAFNYPIESVILHKVVNKEVTSKTLDASDYDIPEKLQNLYFARPIDELMGDSASNYDEGTEYYYVCQVKFAKIIPDDGNLSEENQRTLLAQATMYPILDYFDQYVFAATTAKMIGEIAYTEILTWQSTSRSAPIVALAGAAVSIQKILAQRAVEASAQIGSSLMAKVAVQVASMSVKIVAQTIGEVFEEIVVDGFIEAYFQNSARMLGWSEGVGQLISTLMTTVRETKMFGLFNLGSQGTDTQVEQDLQHSSLTTELSQLIAERDSDQSFNLEKFLRENGKDVKSIMSDLGLVPSRHETILKMAGIIGSGVFAGLSLLIPGLSFAGFSLYGFSPMIKHLGQKVTSPKAGTTTMMRAAISNARQDMVSKDIKIDNILGIKKGYGRDAELGSLSDSATAVQSINRISSSGQAVEYLVGAKLVVLAPQVQASAVTYAPAQSVTNLEAQMGLLKYKTQTQELYEAAKQKEQNLARLENSKVVEAVASGGKAAGQISISLETLSGDLLRKFSKDIKGWDKDISEFNLPPFDGASFKMWDAIDAIKLSFDIDSKVELRFYSPEFGFLTEGRKIASTFVFSEDKQGEVIINKDTLLAQISRLPGLSVVYDVQRFSQFAEFDAYRAARLRHSHIVGGDYRFDEMCSTFEEIEIMDAFFSFVMELSRESLLRVTNNKDIYTVRNNQLDKTAFINKYLSSFHDTLWQNSYIESLIKTSQDKDVNNERWDDWLKTSKMIKNAIPLSILSATSSFKLKDTIIRQGESAIFEYITKDILHLDLDSADIHTAIKEIEKFLDDQEAVKKVAKLFLGPVGITAFWYKFTEAFFDNAKVPGLSITINPNTFSGRIGETIDYSSGFIIRVVKQFIEDGYQPPVAILSGINLGGGSWLDGNVFIQENLDSLAGSNLNDLYDLKNLIIGKDIRPFSILFPSMKRYNDIKLIVTPTTYIATEIKATSDPDGIGNGPLNQLKDDFGSVHAHSLFYELSRGVTQLKDIKIFKFYAGCVPQKGNIDNTLITLIKKMAAAKKFIDYGKGPDHKMDGALTYTFSIIQELNQLFHPILTSSDDRSKIIQDIKDKLANPQFEGELYSIFEDSASNIYSEERFSLLEGSDYLENTLTWLENEIDNLIQEDAESLGHYKLVLNEEIDLLFLDEQGTVLRFEDLPQAFTFIKVNGKLTPTLLTQELFNQYKNEGKPLLVAHRSNDVDAEYKTLPTFGIIPAEIVNLLPQGFSEGYKHMENDQNKGEVFRNVYLCDKNYVRLNSRINIFKEGSVIEINVRPEGWYANFIKVDANAHQSNYYFALTISSGILLGKETHCLAFLQRAEGNLEPYPHIKKLFPSLTRKSMKKFKDGFIFAPIGSGKLIAPDTFFKTYLNLIDLRYALALEEVTSTKRSYVSPYIADKIGLFNVRFTPSTGKFDKSSLRSKSDFEGVINKLFVSKSDILDFLFLKEHSGEIIPMKEGDLTIKEWFHMLFEKITNYQEGSGTDRVSELIKEAKTSFTNKYSENPFDINTDKEKAFSSEEIKAGKIAFEVVSRLIGHFTLRLLFMHMIDFYGSPKSYKIDVLNLPSHDDISKYLRQFSIITSTQSQSTPIVSVQHIHKHLFSLFFLNSYMVLPVEGNINDKDAIISFGYSPISFIDSSFISSSPKAFDSNIASQFKALYNNYKDNYYAGSATHRRIKLFVESGQEMVDALKVILRTKVDSLGLKKDERIDLYNKLLISAEREILNYHYEQIRYKGHPQNNLRFQIEDLLIGDKYNKKIEFFHVEFKHQTFKIWLDKDDFIGKDIKIWRSFTKGREDYYEFQDFNFQGYNYGIVEEMTQILKEAIESAVGENGKVKIYPLYRPNQIDGYQFLLDKDMWEKLVPTERQEILGTNKKDARCFDIDLQDSDIQNKLEHIVKLSMSFIIPSPTSPYSKDFLFIIAKDDLDGKAIYEHDKMIGAFDRNRFYDPDEIFSSGIGSVHHKLVKIDSFESGIKIDSDLIKQWVRARRFLVIPAKYMFPKSYKTWW
jgi:hypothetical protein